MAIKSDVSYVIREEQDGFVAVDFDFINGHDDEIRDWEIVDDCSSIGENSDVDVDFTASVQSDVSSECLSHNFSVEGLDSMPDYSPEMFVSHHRSTAADGDVIEYLQGEADDDNGYSSDNLCKNGEDLHKLFAGEDSKPVPENIVGDREINAVVSVEEILARKHHELLSYRSYRDYDYDYSYDRQEEEEDDYDLDDELVPYSAKMKLGRERMRKLGKRSCSKLVKSKRLTYNYNKAGCVRGKHGLGLKHSLI